LNVFQSLDRSIFKNYTYTYYVYIGEE